MLVGQDGSANNTTKREVGGDIVGKGDDDKLDRPWKRCDLSKM